MNNKYSFVVRKNDVKWSLISQIANLSVGLIIIPLTLVYLNALEVGLYYLFQTFSGLALLADFGFAPTIIRNTTTVFSGASELYATGINKENLSKKIDLKLLSNLIKSTRVIYKKITFLVIIFLLLIGSIYIFYKTPQEINSLKVLLAWILFASSFVLNAYYSYMSSMILGAGDIKSPNKINIFGRILLLALTYIFLRINLSLLGACLAYFISTLITRLITRKFYLSLFNRIFEKAERIKMKPNLMPVLWHNASKMGITYIGSFLTLQGTSIVATSGLDLRIFANFAISNQILVTLSNLSNSYMSICTPKIIQMQLEKNNHKLKKFFGSAYFVSLFLYLGSASLIFFMGNFFLNLIGSEAELLKNHQLLILIIIVFMDINISIFTSYLTTLNIVPYVKSTILTGILTVILSIFFLFYLDLGIWGLLIARVISQAIYNFWKWPLVVFINLKTNPIDLLYIGFVNIINNAKKNFSFSKI